MLGPALLFLNHKKPLEGFEYLYLTEDDYKDLPDGAVMGEWTEVGYALKAVVGLGLSRLDSIYLWIQWRCDGDGFVLG